MVNLVTNTKLIEGMLSVNGKSHVICHVLILQMFGALKKLCFWQNQKNCSIDSTPRIELSCIKAMCRGHRMRSCVGITWRGRVQRACGLPRVICIINGWSYNSVDSLSQNVDISW